MLTTGLTLPFSPRGYGLQDGGAPTIRHQRVTSSRPDCQTENSEPRDVRMQGSAGDPAAPSIAFGPFRLCPRQRLLLEEDKPLRLGSRALDILIALVERPGELVSKRELIARVWPDTVVVEANLTVNVAALRRALGDGHDGNRYLVNVPGRGYCFVAPVEIREE